MPGFRAAFGPQVAKSISLPKWKFDEPSHFWIADADREVIEDDPACANLRSEKTQPLLSHAVTASTRLTILHVACPRRSAHPVDSHLGLSARSQHPAPALIIASSIAFLKN